MTWTNLGIPSPRLEPRRYSPISWPVSRVISLVQSDAPTAASFFSVLASRRTERHFGKLSDNDFSTLLWHMARCQGYTTSPLGFDLEQRPYPSAGAIHPVHLIFHLNDQDGWFRYNARSHQLEEIPGANKALAPLIEQCNAMVTVGAGTIVMFVAEPAMTQAKYDNHASLVWRDAGVVQNTLVLTTAALGWNACLLGITGDPWAVALSNQGELVGVGVAVIGAGA